MRFVTRIALITTLLLPTTAVAQQPPQPTLSDRLDILTGSISRQATDMANKIRDDDLQIGALQREVGGLTTKNNDLQAKLDAATKAADKTATEPAGPAKKMELTGPTPKIAAPAGVVGPDQGPSH